MKKAGFLLILILSISAFGQTQKAAFVTSDTANLREKPNQSAKVVKVLIKGDLIITRLQSKSWFYVEVGKVKGWLHGNTFSFSDYRLLTPTPAGEGWIFLTESADENGVSNYYKKSTFKRNSLDEIEFWVKSIPKNPVLYIRKLKLPKNLAYFIQFMTLNCNDRRLSTENFIAYDSNNATISIPGAELIRNYRTPIVPDSIGEGVWKKFCQ